jgi:hypothetical protein
MFCGPWTAVPRPTSLQLCLLYIASVKVSIIHLVFRNCNRTDRQICWNSWKLVASNLLVDMNNLCLTSSLIIDRPIIVSLLTGCPLAKACGEHDILWTGIWYGFDQLANRKIERWHLLHIIILLMTWIRLLSRVSKLAVQKIPWVWQPIFVEVVKTMALEINCLITYVS